MKVITLLLSLSLSLFGNTATYAANDKRNIMKLSTSICSSLAGAGNKVASYVKSHIIKYIKIYEKT